MSKRTYVWIVALVAVPVLLGAGSALGTQDAPPVEVEAPSVEYSLVETPILDLSLEPVAKQCSTDEDPLGDALTFKRPKKLKCVSGAPCESHADCREPGNNGTCAGLIPRCWCPADD